MRLVTDEPCFADGGHEIRDIREASKERLLDPPAAMWAGRRRARECGSAPALIAPGAPVTALFVAARAREEALADLAGGGAGAVEVSTYEGPQDFFEMLGLSGWTALARRYTR
jgi:hypothetical protein